MARIIIIDDDENFCLLRQRWLQRAGLDTSFHTSPFGTVNRIRKGEFDLVILDINIPGLDGPHLAGLIRESKGLERTKILLCSRMEEDQLRGIAQQAGIGAFVTKSSSQHEFVGAVMAALAGAP